MAELASSARAACASTPARTPPFSLPDEETRRRSAAGTRHVRGRRPDLASQPFGRLHRARHRALSAAWRRADGDGRYRARGGADLDAGARPAARPRSSGRTTSRSTPAAAPTTRARCTTSSSPIRTCKRLMVGETFNPPGNWSSYPPHKHDGKDGEPTLEEVYYFTIDPPQGFGQQILYTNDGESAAHSVQRRRRGAAAVWLSPGVGARRATASAISGAWPANSANWRCTRIPRTSGSTTRSCN